MNKLQRTLLAILFVTFFNALDCMTIFVRTLTGKNFALEVENSDTIATIKKRYKAKKVFHQINKGLYLQASN